MFNTATQISKRTDRIMRAIQAGTVPAGSDAFAELAALTMQMEDQPLKPVVLARMTITRANGNRIIVEVEAGSKFSSFFKFYKQDGARRSTKAFFRHGCRNEGGMRDPRLENIAARITMVQSQENPVVNVKIRIIKRRAYRKLLSARPDQLGLTKMSQLPIYSPVARRSS